MDLETARKALGWSQRELDRKARVARGTTNEIEGGRVARPSMDVAFALFDALRTGGLKGLTVEDVFRRDRKRQAVSR